MFALLSIFDGFIVGMLVFYLINFLFVDKPLVRLIKLLLGIISGIAYFFLCAAINNSDVSIATGLFVLLAPIGLIAIIWLKDYMFKNK